MSEETQQLDQPERSQQNRSNTIPSQAGVFKNKDRLISKLIKGDFEQSIPDHYPELSQEEVLTLLRKGKPVERVYIPYLKLNETFHKLLLLREVYIRNLSIEDAVFEKNLTMQACKIRRTYIENTVFHSSVSFKLSELYFFHMQKSKLHKGFNGESLQVESKFLFSNNVIQERVRFWEASFNDWIQFEDTIFHKRFDMRSSDCKAGLTIHRCHFHDDALFRGMHLAMKWEGNESTFEKKIDFSKAKLHDFVYLEDIIQGDEQTWAFWNTVSERILVTPTQVEGRLESEESGDASKAMREYGVLKRSYEHEHHYNYDDWAFYRFKVNERRSRNALWSRPWTKLVEFIDWLFLDWGCGYGTNPLRAVRASLAMILFFSIIYTLGHNKINPVDHLPFSDLP